LHAYVLMSNHVHLPLPLTPDTEDALSRLMHTFARNCVGLFNGRHGRAGTLWEGRYKASLVDSGRYFLACSRYIGLNPVRAWMGSKSDDWPRLSHAAHVGERVDPLLTRM
jgi:putative transposase